MKIETDKKQHFIAGAAIAFVVATITWLLLNRAPHGFPLREISAACGIWMAMLAEAGKIVFYDIPNARDFKESLDWKEKVDDIAAQFIGAGCGAALFYFLASLMP